MEEETKIILAAIDQLDGELAVLVSEELSGPIYLPFTVLPPDSQEGDILQITIARREAATRKCKKEVAQLIEKLSSVKTQRPLKKR